MITAVLAAWLIRTKALDAGSLNLLGRSDALFWTLFTFVLVTNGLATTRWLSLLRAFDVRVPPVRALGLQLMALFFNNVIPGNVGGDFIKNAYVMRGRPVDVFALATGERLLGTIALVWTGFGIALANSSRILAEPRLHAVFGVLFALAVGGLLGPLVLFWGLKKLRLDPKSSISRLLEQLRSAIQLFVDRPRYALIVFALSVLIHFGNLNLFYQMAQIAIGEGAELGFVALVFPVGMLTLMLPVSLAGLGVGHLAFDRLFQLAGLSGGANVFHLFIVANVGPCVLGAIPYLFLRRELPKAETV